MAIILPRNGGLQLSLLSLELVEVDDDLHWGIATEASRRAKLEQITWRRLEENCPPGCKVKRERGAVGVRMIIQFVSYPTDDIALVMTRLRFPVQGQGGSLRELLQKFEVPEENVLADTSELVVPVRMFGDLLPARVPPPVGSDCGNGKQYFVAKRNL